MADPRVGEAYADVAAAVGGFLFPIEDLTQPADWSLFMDEVISKFYVDDMPLSAKPVDGKVEAWKLPADGSEPYGLVDGTFTYDAPANRARITGLAEDDEAVLLYEPL